MTAQSAGGEQHRGMQHDMSPKSSEDGPAHAHAAVPREYAQQHLRPAAWTDPAILVRGKSIYDEKCAVCHGTAGDGKGPGTAALPVKPPDMRDAKMIAEMPDSYWFWRVSEGGFVEPFRSRGSVMPPWKNALSADDRWAVIAYEHSFSGHTGPHVATEHPEMRMAEMHDSKSAQPDADSKQTPAPAHKH